MQGSEETSVRTLGHVVLFARVAAGFFESAFEGADIKPVRYAGSATRAQLTSLYTRYANAAMKSSMSGFGEEEEAAAADSADMAQLDLLQFIFEIDEKQARARALLFLFLFVLLPHIWRMSRGALITPSPLGLGGACELEDGLGADADDGGGQRRHGRSR